MEEIIIWHNPRCRKSREGLNYLKSKGVEPRIFEYLKGSINPKELAELIKKSGEPVENFIRKNEKEYKELGLKNKNLTPEEFAEIVAKHPRLLQRPIVIRGDKVVLGQPVEKIDTILSY